MYDGDDGGAHGRNVAVVSDDGGLLCGAAVDDDDV